ncbi:MAG TPA: hypothetical protein PLB62_02245 [Candidatus Sumerlaeota bacterium]|nr:hypothetical protein [Candidatus Sumerlaeota bacterium]
MRALIIFTMLILAASCAAQETFTILVRDEATTLGSVETLISDNGISYWGEKALASLFGASAKAEGENLIILCKDVMCVPFYKDDPKRPVMDYKGKPFLSAEKVAEAFGYPRLETDKAAGIIHLYKTRAADPPVAANFRDTPLADPSGKIIPTSPFAGRRKIAILWAPWKDSREFLTSWNRFAEEEAGGIPLILISESIQEREVMDTALDFLKPRPTTLVDPGLKLGLTYHFSGPAMAFLIDEKGLVAAGPVTGDPRDEVLRGGVSEWVAGKPWNGPAPLETPAPPKPEILKEASSRIELARTLWQSGKRNESIMEFQRAGEILPGHPLMISHIKALNEAATPRPAASPTQTNSGSGKE